MRKRTQGGYSKSNWGRRRIKGLHAFHGKAPSKGAFRAASTRRYKKRLSKKMIGKY